MDDKKKKRQEELALVFYEMGMEEDLVMKISGIEKEDYENLKKRKKDVKPLDTSRNNNYNNEAK